MNIYLLRHASTIEEKLSFKGTADAPLSSSGVAEAIALGARWRAEGMIFNRIYSSPLSRAARTAELVCGGENIQPVNELIDINCGSWENRDVDSVRKRHPRLFARWLNKPASFTFPEGESVSNAAARSFAFLNKITSDDHNQNAQNILIVTHRLIINLMVLCALEINLNKYWLFRYDNCRFSILCSNYGNFHLKALNSN